MCGAAQDQAGQVAAPSRAHHDGAGVVGPRGGHDLARRVPVDRGRNLVVSLDARIGQLLRSALDRCQCFRLGFGREQPGAGQNFALPNVQQPDLAVRQQRQIPGSVNYSSGGIRTSTATSSLSYIGLTLPGRFAMCSR